MYKLLIVDDEPLVQVGIKSMLDWNALGIEVCGIASNGQSALSIIEECNPSIVITDIKMPIMNGLELAKACQERYGATSPYFIVLTSFEEFELVREAMRYKVAEYLIKLELTPSLLSDTIKKVIERIMEDYKVNEPPASATTFISSFNDKFFISLLHNLFEDRQQFELQANELKLDFSFESYLCCYLEIISKNNEDINLYNSALLMSQNLLEKYNRCYVVPLDLRHFAIVFTDIGFEQVKSYITNVSASLSNYYKASLICGIGTNVFEPLSISQSYQYARDAYSNASTESPVVSFEECAKNMDYKKSFNFAIFKDSLSRAYEEFDQELLDNTLSDIISLFKSHPGHYVQAMDCASNILYMSISLIPNGEDVVSSLFTESPNGYRNLYELSTMEQIVGWLSIFKTGLLEYFAEHKKDTRKPIVANIKKYIKENTNEHLSLNEVAAVFGISPNYLSQLFKKYNDCGFNEYVTNCKINEARRLLSSGEYKVYEVAEMLGFENAFYFSKVFKKVVGIPPTTFLNKD